jgi:hypothetical protein
LKLVLKETQSRKVRSYFFTIDHFSWKERPCHLVPSLAKLPLLIFMRVVVVVGGGGVALSHNVCVVGVVLHVP